MSLFGPSSTVADVIASMPSGHRVYMVQIGSLVKIGCSRDVGNRLHFLASSSKIDRSVAEVSISSEVSDCFYVEKRLHKLFAEHLVKAERFDVSFDTAIKKANESGESILSDLHDRDTSLQDWQIALRGMSELSRMKISDSVGVSPYTVWHWSNGRTPKNPGVMKKLRRVMRRMRIIA